MTQLFEQTKYAGAAPDSALLLKMFEEMSAHFGPCHWWPADSPFEIVVGAVLTQNTSWRNVEKALDILKAKRALRPEALVRMSREELEESLRPSGFYKVKAARLRNLLAWFMEFPGWDAAPGNIDLAFLQHLETDELRQRLLSVSGIGPETADCILLYALQRPTFVVDAYTRRIFERHGLLVSKAGYEEIRSFFMNALPRDPILYNECHALVVRTGNTFCKRNKSLCSQCPLGYRVSYDFGE